jgi:hypothetical protein
MSSDAEFFTDLASCGVSWVFTWFDVPTRRQPEAGIDVIDQKSAAVGRIDHDGICDQMLVGRRRFRPPEHIIRGLQPRERLGPVLRFNRVPRLYAADESVYGENRAIHR